MVLHSAQNSKRPGKTRTARVYYDLENLWGDAKRVDWQSSPDQTPA
jgi:hypothetical protein